MKEETIRPAAPALSVAVCRSKLLSALLTIVLTGLNVCPLASQSCKWKSVFYDDERINYEIYFKWGLIMSKAGQASFTVDNATYSSSPAWKYELNFSSSGVVEKFYKIRDTMTVYFSPESKILFSSKHSDEDGFYLIDELSFKHSGADNVSIHSYRAARSSVRIDTTMEASGCVFDMLSAVMYLRSLDWDNLHDKAVYSFKVAVGKDIVNIHYRYAGRELLKHNDGSKYDTHHFHVDVYDPAFSQSKEAAEAWIGSDENHIPIRVRAKLKIGAAEVYYKTSSNLRFPLNSRLTENLSANVFH